jgi:hypothetical protein
MSSQSPQNLKAIRFEGELLPNWAQLLDLAGGLCPVSEETRNWFSRLTNSSGVDDARTVVTQCQLLKASLQERRNTITVELQRNHNDSQASQIYAAWMYALETMIQQASTKKTCSWYVEGIEQADEDDSGGGDITLRRV